MAGISYEHWRQTARFRNPLKGGELDAQDIEIRLDPLTGHQSVFNPALNGKVAILFPETDEAYLEARAKETQPHCFLCDGRWEKMTPQYAEDFIPGGRLIHGDVVLFPNLFPLSAYHAVVMMGIRHFVPIQGLSFELIRQAFEVSLDFIRRCHEHDPDALYFTINANYLFPAGASVIHPHLQIIGAPQPGTHHRLLLERSRSYFEEKGSCYWMDLLETEQTVGNRMLGEIGNAQWMTAFSPLGANEVNAICPRTTDFLEWGNEEIEGIARGLVQVFRGYHAMRFSTFNLSCFSGPLGKSCPEFRCFLRLVNRQNVMPHYRTDDYYFQKLLENEIILHQPEKLAELLRGYF